MDVYRYFKSLTDIIRYLILVKFNRIIRLVEFNKFLKYKVDISKNLRLIDLSGFSKFQFRVKVISYKVFLFVIGGGK